MLRASRLRSLLRKQRATPEARCRRSFGSDRWRTGQATKDAEKFRNAKQPSRKIPNKSNIQQAKRKAKLK